MRKFTRTGTVTRVFTPSFDMSGEFAATLQVAVQNDEGREYYIHVTAEQIAALAHTDAAVNYGAGLRASQQSFTGEIDAEDIGTSVNARLDALAAEIQALRTK